MSKCLRAIAVALAVSSAACSIDVRGENLVVHEERRFTASGATELDLRTFDGAVEVRTWDRDEVLVDIQRRAANTVEAEELQVNASQEGNRIVLEAVPPTARREGVVQLGGSRSRTVSFVVTAPRRVTLRVSSGDGPISVRDLEGNVTLQTGDGPVQAEDVRGALDVSTGDGPIALNRVRGGVNLNTGDGMVDARGIFEDLRIVTGDGPVQVDAIEGSTITRGWSIETGDGPITLRLPGQFNAELDAFSGDGPITLAGQARATPSRNHDRSTLRASIGTGGPPIRLRTGDGPISVSH